MDINEFIDKLFDIINDSELPIKDLDLLDNIKTLRITLEDGSGFEIKIT